MPCQTCNMIFKINPCDHQDGILRDGQDIFIEKRLSIYDLKKQYYNLYIKCPCKECLVRPVCISGRNCEEFMDRILIGEK